MENNKLNPNSKKLTLNSPLKLLFITLLISSFTQNTIANQIYSINSSNVINLNSKNFQTQITQTRAKATVSFVHFYKSNDGKSMDFKKEIESMSLEYDGMFKIAGIDCGEHAELCEKEDVREFPTFKIYPPLPAPVFPYEQDIKAKTIINALGRFVENKTIEVHSNNVDSFVSENPQLPKAILFTDKDGIPLIYKVLAVQFDKKFNFGVVRKSESAITQKYKVNKFPRIMVIPIGGKKNEFFEGQKNFKDIFNFINVFSETFFKVGEDKTRVSEETKADKPWLNEKLPEINAKSGNEVCFKVEGILCVILISNGKPDAKTTELISELQNYLSPKIDRGIKYKFGWVNSDTQTKFMEVVQVSSVPKLILVNPGKRKRFFISEDELNMDVFENVFEKLASGDLRFKMFPGNEVPELAE